MSEIRTRNMMLGPLYTNCYLLMRDDRAVLIDAPEEADVIMRVVREEGVELTDIFLTHSHFDHVDAVNDLRRELPDVKVWIGEKDEPGLSDVYLNMSESFLGRRNVTKADMTVTDGQELEILGTTCRCIEVPGHTVGGMCYYFPELGVVYDGDTLFEGSIGRSDFPGGSERVLVDSIKRKLMVLPDDTRVMPGHGDATTVKRERRANYFLI